MTRDEIIKVLEIERKFGKQVLHEHFDVHATYDANGKKTGSYPAPEGWWNNRMADLIIEELNK